VGEGDADCEGAVDRSGPERAAVLTRNALSRNTSSLTEPTETAGECERDGTAGVLVEAKTLNIEIADRSVTIADESKTVVVMLVGVGIVDDVGSGDTVEVFDCVDEIKSKNVLTAGGGATNSANRAADQGTTHDGADEVEGAPGEDRFRVDDDSRQSWVVLNQTSRESVNPSSRDCRGRRPFSVHIRAHPRQRPSRASKSHPAHRHTAHQHTHRHAAHA